MLQLLNVDDYNSGHKCNQMHVIMRHDLYILLTKLKSGPEREIYLIS